jgi:N-acetylmuramoyl-L-alanine amidase
MAQAEIEKVKKQILMEAKESAKEEAKKAAAVSYSEEDYQVLLQIVHAEAGTEDIVGRILVADVILNRLEIGFGGNTITEVVFEKDQFSPVVDGRIFKVVPDEITVEAVERALDGEDCSKGALYFMNRKRASKKGIRWFDKHLEFLFKHGEHEFYAEKD